MTWRMMIVMTGLSLIMIGAAMPMSNPSPQVGDPLPGLTPDELARFTQGKAVFSRDFTPDTGLGPFFNNTSCAQCHEDPVTGGAGAFNQSDVDVERHATAGDQPTCNELATVGGPVFREQTTGPALPPIPADAAVHVGLRATPMLFGFGLIEAIPESAIEANTGRAGGRAARLPNGQLGRFGRKATDSDLLLHDMGPALADLCKGVAGRAEFRTEPLMGLRARTRFLHDGRALTLESAIAQHGGQGTTAATAFLNLSRHQREELLRFLKSL